MKTLNLANKQISSINYNIIQFPDGQRNVEIIDQEEGEYHSTFDSIEPILIKSRFKTL